jgi:hypothetical protein
MSCLPSEMRDRTHEGQGQVRGARCIDDRQRGGAVLEAPGHVLPHVALRDGVPNPPITCGPLLHVQLLTHLCECAAANTISEQACLSGLDGAPFSADSSISLVTSAWRAPLFSRLVYLGDDTGLVCELPTDMAFSMCLHTTPHPWK